jgi:outer membrane protein
MNTNTERRLRTSVSRTRRGNAASSAKSHDTTSAFIRVHPRLKVYGAVSLFFIALTLFAVSAGAEPAQTLTLRQAHERALRNHPQLAAAQLQALASLETVRQARSSFFPTADAYLTAVGAGNENTRILAGALNNPSIYDRAAGGVTVSQLITDFGQTSNLTASAKSQAKAEQQGATATREEVLLNVDVNYFGLLEAQAVLRVAQATLNTRQLLLDQVNALAANKLKSQLDVSFAQVALGEAQLLQEKAEGDVEAAEASLSAALGDRELRRYTLVDPNLASALPDDVSPLIGKALGNRPEILRLRYEQEAAQSFARAQKDERYPTVAAVGTIGDSPDHDVHLPEHYAAAGVNLSIPLFAGGLYLARQHEAELKARAAAEDLRDEEDSVIRDVRTAWLNCRTTLERLRTTEQLLKHATEAFDLARARYKIGSSSIVELSEAQLSQTSAEIAQASAHYDELIQRSILDYQVGALN